jgi:hypothetical protein
MVFPPKGWWSGSAQPALAETAPVRALASLSFAEESTGTVSFSTFEPVRAASGTCQLTLGWRATYSAYVQICLKADLGEPLV